ncbi:phenylalanine--tRNA ligase subunit alpha [Haploplasma axanthum]|nr:phenylalanine--tRNA ligase subunit alpha [Haploplasma axanthum]
MNNSLEELRKVIIEKIESVLTLDDIEKLRNQYLSKKGELSQQMAKMKDLPNDEKPLFGKLINEVKELVENRIISKINDLKEKELLKKLENEKIDVTIPADEISLGTIHPLNQVIEDLEDFFIGQGYEVKEGPEVESDFYNFEMMNFSKGHPARDMQDTFYITEETLLRTHTSPVQARAMLEKNGKPVKAVCPGKTYRRDEDDPTHSHQFMQFEGIVVDKGISFANLKDTLLNMTRHLFGNDREIRIRPSYFPFVEPGVEVDVVYIKPDGTKGYIEILGAGLVHPNVLRMGGYDPDVYSGFAFGIGIERIAILKYGVEDIRNFYINDIRFLQQFKGDLS